MTDLLTTEDLAFQRQTEAKNAGFNVNRLLVENDVPRRKSEAWMSGEIVSPDLHFNIIEAITSAVPEASRAERFIALYDSLSGGDKLEKEWSLIRESSSSKETQTIVRSNQDATVQFNRLTSFTPAFPPPELYEEKFKEKEHELLRDASVLGRINLAPNDFSMEKAAIDDLNEFMALCKSIAEKQFQGPLSFEDSRELWARQEARQAESEQFMSLTKRLNAQSIFIETFFLTRPRIYTSNDRPIAKIPVHALAFVVSNGPIFHITFDLEEVKNVKF